MQETKFEREMDFPVSQVWDLLADFPRLDWLTLKHDLEVIGNGMLGTVRIITMEGAAPTWEVLLAKDVDNKSVSYAVPVGLFLPVSNYTATMKLEALSEKRTKLHWHGTWIPNDGESSDEVRTEFIRVYNALADGIETVLKDGA